MANREGSETRDHVSVEITEDALVSSIKEKMEAVCASVCISRVPAELRKGNEKTYIPDKVSIGPFHHGKDTLSAMEDLKWRYLYYVLNRKPNLEASMDGCVKVLREMEHRARRCYSETINLTSNQFVQIMLLDGCFIIELFFKNACKSLRRRSDPIFSTPGMFVDIMYNLILLENQIPYFVLQRLFQIIPIPRQCSLSLNELAFRFFKNMMQGDRQALWEKFDLEGNHLLDMIRHCFHPTYPRQQPKYEMQQGLDCATGLQKAGIRLKKANTKNLLDVKFVNGVLEIPPLRIHKNTETLFKNLIGYEQRHCENTQHITSYAFLMGNLICSKKDVKLLGRQNILISDRDEEKEVSQLFMKLCRDEKVKDFYYAGLFERVSEYRRIGWHVSWQKLKGNPSAKLMLFIVAILLLALTFIGSLFSVISFFLHHGK
ncbi:UPF0481 protein At3g47200-like [Alnus glutinosa]|uniref:UPF0481 protein At3g47200-like n=1 Tax=Alnus glutinosa TaxID=3517 RepID=UPI002D76B535|nr:UPF0481 protein At3g47200-like [Alnus glutinosa]